MAEVVSAAVGTTILLGSFVLFLFYWKERRRHVLDRMRKTKKKSKQPGVQDDSISTETSQSSYPFSLQRSYTLYLLPFLLAVSTFLSFLSFIQGLSTHLSSATLFVARSKAPPNRIMLFSFAKTRSKERSHSHKAVFFT